MCADSDLEREAAEQVPQDPAAKLRHHTIEAVVSILRQVDLKFLVDLSVALVIRKKDGSLPMVEDVLGDESEKK